jgi:hypothetical protein
MTAQSCIDYFVGREAEERAAAAASTDLKAQDVHLDFAERYADIVAMAAELEHETTKAGSHAL